MCQPKKWWIGLLPLAALWLLTLWFKTAPIEADLTSRSAAQVVAERASDTPGGWAELAVAGRDVTLSGRAPAEGLQTRAADAADRVFGVRLVNSAASLLEAQKPFTWAAARDGGKLTLTGFVAPDDSREKIVAAAKTAFPGVTIDDQMKAARGAPAASVAMAGFGLGQLAKLEKGAVSLSDLAYSIVGTAPTPDIYGATLAAVKSLPESMSLAKADITPPTVKPYLWSAERKGNEVTLSGFIPADNVRTSLSDAARQAFSGASVVDKMQLALGAPQNFAEAALAGIGQLGQLIEGKASLSDLAFSLSGRSADFKVNTSAVTDSLRAKFPAGFAQQISVEAPPPPPLPTARPFVWSATKAADGVSAVGFAPNESALKMAADRVQALAPAARFTNELRVAQGLPAGVDFSAATAFATAQLGALRTGAVRLTDNRISLTGQAADWPVYRAVTTALNGVLPAGLEKDQIAVTVAPYGWGVSSAGDVVTLTGLVPDDRAKQQILAAAGAAFPRSRIVDEMNIAAGAPSCFGPLTATAVRLAGRLDNGAAQFDGATLRVSGIAGDRAIADEVQATASTGWADCARGAAEITVRPAAEINLPAPPAIPAFPAPPPADPAPPPAYPPPAPVISIPLPLPVDQCPVLIQAVLDRDRILFDTAKATIRPESHKVLEDIAGVLLACKGARFEVAAHTDSDGDADMNQDLSERRAAAVVEHLTRLLSVSADQLTAKGYGATKPIAPNTTAEGKQRNRRVEFSLAN